MLGAAAPGDLLNAMLEADGRGGMLTIVAREYNAIVDETPVAVALGVSHLTPSTASSFLTELKGLAR